MEWRGLASISFLRVMSKKNESVNKAQMSGSHKLLHLSVKKFLKEVICATALRVFSSQISVASNKATHFARAEKAGGDLGGGRKPRRSLIELLSISTALIREPLTSLFGHFWATKCTCVRAHVWKRAFPRLFPHTGPLVHVHVRTPRAINGATSL